MHSIRKKWLPKDMLPQMVDGKWRGPRLSAMKVAKLRKNALIEGKVFIGADHTKGEWDPRWEKLRAPNLLKPPRGRLGLRKRPQKMERIKQALATMDAKIAERSRKNTVPLTFFEKVLKSEGVVESMERRKRK